MSDEVFQTSGVNISSLQATAKWEQLGTIQSPQSLNILDSLKPHVQRRQAKERVKKEEGDSVWHLD